MPNPPFQPLTLSVEQWTECLRNARRQLETFDRMMEASPRVSAATPAPAYYHELTCPARRGGDCTCDQNRLGETHGPLGDNDEPETEERHRKHPTPRDCEIAEELISKLQLEQSSNLRRTSVENQPESTHGVSVQHIRDALRARFGITRERATDEGFSETVIDEIVKCLSAAEQPAQTWQPIETAPRLDKDNFDRDWDNRVDVLLKFRNGLSGLMKSWCGLQIVGHWTPYGWNFSGPTGFGGFADDDFEGWMPLPAPLGPVAQEKE